MKDKKLSVRLEGCGSADKTVKNASNARAAHGRIGEDAAAEFLERNGYTVKGRNVRLGRHELDIIAEDDEYLVFVEVKYRKDNSSGYSLAAVNPAKQKTICKVARYFLTVEYHNVDIPCRFDVAGIDGDEIHWVKNAFEYITIL